VSRWYEAHHWQLGYAGNFVVQLVAALRHALLDRAKEARHTNQQNEVRESKDHQQNYPVALKDVEAVNDRVFLIFDVQKQSDQREGRPC